MRGFILLAALYISAGYSSTHHPQVFLEAIRNRPDEGQQIVQHYCASCHAQKPLISLGAPRIQVKEDWENRLKQGFDTLFNHTDAGMGAMPPRGGCFECTDEQLRKAIQYMALP